MNGKKAKELRKAHRKFVEKLLESHDPGRVLIPSERSVRRRYVQAVRNSKKGNS